MNRAYARFVLACIAGLLAFSTGNASAEEAARCDESAGPLTFVPLPGSPFAATASPDGCSIFVTLTADFAGAQNGIALLRRAGGKVSLERILADNDTPYGMALMHDGKLLAVANNTNVVVLDAERLIAGQNGTVAGYASESGSANPLNINANVTPDDRYLFVAEEAADRIAVIDLERERRDGFAGHALIGTIPAGLAPIAIAFSPDARFLYVTVQQATESDHWPVACKPQGEDPATAIAEDPEGAVMVIDAERAKTDPENSLVAKVPAGCGAVRLALSPDGARAYVTARGDDALLVFDTEKLARDPEHARIASVPVGVAPVGIAVVDKGRKIIVANSNRFAATPAASETLSVIDAEKVDSGKDAVIGTIRAGQFPRELSVTADGKTLLVTNSGSDSLELVDLERLPFLPDTR